MPKHNLPAFSESRRRYDDVRNRRVHFRHEAIWQARYTEYCSEYYYLIHGHAVAYTDLQQFPLNGVQMIFYCADGETTVQAEERNPNAAWSKLLNRLRIGATVPSEHVVETIQQRCRALYVYSQTDVPDAGVYFVIRAHENNPPHAIHKLRDIPADGIGLSTIITQTIRPDSIARGLDKPVNIHWIACRAHRTLHPSANDMIS